MRLANTFWTRAKGLLGKKELGQGEGLIITPCSSIHSFGMRFLFDAIFLNKDLVVIRVVPNIGPCRILYVPGSRHVVELPAGATLQHQIQLNHRMYWCR